MARKNTLASYTEKRVISVFILGIASGLPWVMIGSALALWLKESGISRTEIGYSGLIFAVYSINFLWSPLVDRFNMFLFRGAHQRRQSWILPCQLGIAVFCLAMQFFSPNESASAVVLIGLGIALCSATQDIAIDAYRIDSFGPTETQLSSMAAGATTAGWWTGYAGLGFLPLYLSDHGWQWQELYALMALSSVFFAFICFKLPRTRFLNQRDVDEKSAYIGIVCALGPLKKMALVLLVLSPILLTLFVVIGSPGVPVFMSAHSGYVPTAIALGLSLAILTAFFLSTLLAAKPTQPSPSTRTIDRFLAHTLSSICEPIRDFFTRNGTTLAVQILLFIFLFKIGEAFLGRMSIVFYKEIGFSNTDIATYSKMLTWWITVIAAVVAGALNARLGLLKGLFLSGIAMAASNLMFALIAQTGPSIPLYITTIIVDGVSAAWSLVAFVAFISALCNHQFSASQYALFASLGALGRTTLSSLSGQIIDLLHGNWTLFFLLTTLMVIPSMLILLNLNKNKVFRANLARKYE